MPDKDRRVQLQPQASSPLGVDGSCTELLVAGDGGTLPLMAAFADKLQLVLKALSLSRARLASELQVDKSLVGRWVSGATAPSAYNLERLTARVALAHPSFTALDWDLDLPALAERLGAAPRRSSGPSDGFGQWLTPKTLEEIAATTEQRGHAYEGFWRSTRPAYNPAGRFIHDVVMVRRAPNGMLVQKIGLSGFVFQGWVMPLRNQLFSTATHPGSGMLIFSIFNGVARVKAEVIDGITLSCLTDAGGSPVASACVMERIGDLTGDTEADDEHFRELLKTPPLAPEGSIAAEIRDHLYRDIGPSAAALGGDPILRLFYGASLSRGPALAEAV
jgi:transcriptional regulator with XRE-family HTH domain